MSADADLVRREGFDADAGGRLRGALALPLVLAVTTLYLLIVFPLARLCGAWFRPRQAASLRLWGRTVLALLGLRLSVHGREHLPTRGPALILFTHQSLCDLALVASIWPEHASVIFKQEFHAIPLMGSTMAALGMIAIDRSDPVRSRESLDRAAERMAAEHTLLFMAPEGTRSRADGLLPFKKGPFHLALATGAPITPLAFRGVRQVMPAGSWLARPGQVRADVLPAIDTSNWREDTLNEHIEDVRARFLALVPAASARKPTPDCSRPTER